MRIKQQNAHNRTSKAARIKYHQIILSSTYSYIAHLLYFKKVLLFIVKETHTQMHRKKKHSKSKGRENARRRVTQQNVQTAE